jgi:hypothetical protein
MMFRALFASVVLGAIFATGACGAGSASSGGLGGDGFGGTSPSSGSKSGGGLSGSGGGLDVGAGGSSGCPTHCSADLHEVIDCKDHVVKTCSDTTACGKSGACVAPCEGAADNASTVGCDFYSVVPAPESGTRGSCFAMLLANTWTSPVSITAERGGTQLDISGSARIAHQSGATLSYDPLPNGQLPVGEIGIIFLSGLAGSGERIGCPAGVSPGVPSDVSVTGSGIGAGFHVTTSAPVVAYDMYPYGGAKSYVSSATLLVPTPAWGTNYVAADAYEEDPAIASDGGIPFIQIVAAEDGTMVTIDPKTAIVGSATVAASAAGTPHAYALSKGQVLQLAQDQELAGSPIQSNKPISVWGGSGCMNIPVGHYACDSAHQELLPVKALGHAYTAVRYRDRVAGNAESVPWTIVGAVAGTTLSYDPAPPTGAPTTLGVGDVKTFSASDPFAVKAQDAEHPFYVAGHMTGWTNLPNSNQGDPEYVSMIPPAQWLENYLFLTDPTYANSHLVFVRQQNKAGTFDDVTLDCVGAVAGWQPIGSGGDYEYAWVDLVVAGANQGTCANGVHTSKSTTPFGLTVWGWDFAVSYGYPAGMSTQAINKVVVPVVPK